MINKFSIRNLINSYIENKPLKIKHYLRYFIFDLKSEEIKFNILENSGITYTVFAGMIFKLFRIFFKKETSNIFTFVSLLPLFLINQKFNFINFMFLYLLKIILKDKQKAFSINTIGTLLFFPYKYNSYDFIIPLLFRLFTYYKFNFSDSKTIVLLLSSVYFYKISIFKVYFYKLISFLNIIMYIFSLLFIFNDVIYDKVIDIYLVINEFITKNDFLIKGKLNLFGFIVIFVLLSLIKNKRPIKTNIIIILVLFFNISNIFTTIDFIDVGHGDSVLLKSYFNQETVLIDTGSKINYFKLKKHLYLRGVEKIDTLIISHKDEDHYGNIENLKKDFKISNIIYDHQDIKLKTMYFKSLNQVRNTKNDSSLVHLVDIDGKKILFTGDISKWVEEKLIEEYDNLKVDILKVAHHGSSTSTSPLFLNKTKPAFAIISCSDKYNFPNNDVLKDLDKSDTNYFVTKEVGSIEVYFLNFINFFKHRKGLIFFN